MCRLIQKTLAVSSFAMLLISAGAVVQTATGAAIQLHPENPHYFLWRGRPTVLITSGEHYGAVLNRAFDYEKYLRTLESLGFNLTRTFSGAYCEGVGAFKIQDNTLAPTEGDLICPWVRSDQGGYLLQTPAKLRQRSGQTGRRGRVGHVLPFLRR